MADRGEALTLAVAVFVAFCCTAANSQCTFQNSVTAGFASCADLMPSTLAWTYMKANNTASIAYTDIALSPSGWVGWGINFNGSSMVNSDAILAFKQPNGSASALRYKLTAAVYDNIALPLMPVADYELQVLNMSALIVGSSFTIFATFHFPAGTSTSINIVYNRGPSVTNNVPAPHNLGQRNGMKTIDLAAGTVLSTGAHHSPRSLLKTLHAALALASWGVLIILGAMTARYLKQVPSADPAWFYMHVSLQTSAYLVGITAWAMGLRLGALSPGIEYHSHRSMGISIFTLASLQMCSLFIRPHKQHKLRHHWNIYHHALGYSIIILGVINVFKGFAILVPPQKFKVLYIAFLVVAASASLALEGATWFHFFFRHTTTTTRRRQQQQQQARRREGLTALARRC
eukprot:c22038_g3_i1 orf=185-1393(+)